jgi:hypothetical protein
VPPRTSAALPLLGQEKGGGAAANPDVITVASHTKKDNPAGLPTRPSSPPAAPGSPYVLTRSAGGHLAGGLLAVDCAACLVVARLFDRERLITGARPSRGIPAPAAPQDIQSPGEVTAHRKGELRCRRL